MSAVRGMPQPLPEKPELEPVPSIFKPGERKAAQAENAARQSAYEAEEARVGEINKKFGDITPYVNPLISGGSKELGAASHVRLELVKSSDATIAPYTDPAEYIADLWADGHLSKEKVTTLLGKLLEDGGIETTISAANRKLAYYGPGHEHIYNRSLYDALFPNLPEDSVEGFLLHEAMRGHLSTNEGEAMFFSHEARKDAAHSPEELAEMRQALEEALERPGVDKATAVKLAMGRTAEVQGHSAARENLEHTPNPDMPSIRIPQPENLQDNPNPDMPRILSPQAENLPPPLPAPREVLYADRERERKNNRDKEPDTISR